MKEKIIVFIIGILLGAVLATGVFYIYTTNNVSKCKDNTQMNGMEPPEMPNGEMGQPPEKPDDNNTQNSN